MLKGKLTLCLDIINEMHNKVTELTDEVERLVIELEIAHQKIKECLQVQYVPVKNDEIDQMLADFVNKNNLPLNFIRVAKGI